VHGDASHPGSQDGEQEKNVRKKIRVEEAQGVANQTNILIMITY
jgi:hypothetical protein